MDPNHFPLQPCLFFSVCLLMCVFPCIAYVLQQFEVAPLTARCVVTDNHLLSTVVRLNFVSRKFLERIHPASMTPALHISLAHRKPTRESTELSLPTHLPPFPCQAEGDLDLTTTRTTPTTPSPSLLSPRSSSLCISTPTTEPKMMHKAVHSAKRPKTSPSPPTQKKRNRTRVSRRFGTMHLPLGLRAPAGCVKIWHAVPLHHDGWRDWFVVGEGLGEKVLKVERVSH
ncbi:hypothetical protein BC567DRAFT_51563 [Phyllosticta citribraziliensis]